MYKLQVTADKLNIRNSPEADDTNENWVGDLNKGAEFHAVKLIKGKFYEGTDLWYGDEFNKFVSASYVKVKAQEYINARFINGQITEPIDYNFLLNIDPKLKANKGVGITIGILDSGIRQDLNFTNKIIRPFPLAGKLLESHGSFIAGIIAGDDGIKGIAPDAKIIELPLRKEDGTYQSKDITDKIFNFISSYPEPIILNVSQRLKDRYHDEFANLRNALIVSAAGVDQDLQNELIFPASLDNAITVGVLTESFRSSSPKLKLNAKLNLVFSAFNFVSYGTNIGSFKINEDTSSFATGITSGILSLFYSGILLDLNPAKAIQKLQSISPDYDLSQFDFLNSIKSPK